MVALLLTSAAAIDWHHQLLRGSLYGIGLGRARTVALIAALQRFQALCSSVT